MTDALSSLKYLLTRTAGPYMTRTAGPYMPMALLTS